MHHLTEREQNALWKKPVANNESKNDKKKSKWLFFVGNQNENCEAILDFRLCCWS